MTSNRITRREIVRRALLLGATAFLLTALVACGGDTSATRGDKERDVRVLNEILGRQLAVVAAYDQVLLRLRGANLAAAEQFRAHEQEHLVATTKLLQRLGGEADPVEETIETDDVKTAIENLELLYEMESATIDLEQHAVSKLTTDWARPLIAAMASNQAQRLVLLRRALGTGPLEAVPSAFETGETPAPEGTGG
jgi:hypothetical protein